MVKVKECKSRELIGGKGQLKMRERKTRHRQKCMGAKRETGKRGTSV